MINIKWFFALAISYLYFNFSYATDVKWLTDLSNIIDNDIQGSHVLPFANRADSKLYIYKIPNKIIPIKFTSKQMIFSPAQYPLDIMQFFHHHNDMNNVVVNAYLTLPGNFSLDKKYRLAVYLHTSAGLTPQDFCDAKKLNDRGIVVCLINYAHLGKFVIDPMNHHPLIPALHAFRSMSILEKAPFLESPAAAIGVSYGATALLQSLTTKFIEIATRDLINKNPFNLYLLTGGLPFCRYNDLAPHDIKVYAYHGDDDQYCLPNAIIDFAQYSRVDITLYLLKNAGHLFHYDPELRNMILSHMHRKDVIKDKNTNKFQFNSPTSRIKMQAVENSGNTSDKKCNQITYEGLPQVSRSVYISQPINSYAIDKQIFDFMQSGDPVGLQNFMKNETKFKDYFLPDDSKQFTFNELFVKFLKAYPVELIGEGTFEDRKSVSFDEVIKSMKYENHIIKSDLSAGTYMRNKWAALIHQYTGANAQDQQYQIQDDLVSRADGHNIITISQDEMAILESDSLKLFSLSTSPVPSRSGSISGSAINSSHNALDINTVFRKLNLGELKLKKFSIDGSKSPDPIEDDNIL